MMRYNLMLLCKQTTINKAEYYIQPYHSVIHYTSYVVDAVLPPRPVQLVWKNSPRALSLRS